MSSETQQIKESHVIFIAGLIQLVHAIDFMMVMPLGPDFAKALNISLGEIGLIGGVYAFAASVAGLVGSFFLDNHSRKRALLFFIAGLSLSTIGGAIAWDRTSMIAARVFAGLCGGPLSALTIALLADYIPPQRRGAAMGKVMGAFSVSSVLGMPLSLELARIFSWHAPFITTGILGFIAFFFTLRFLPYHPPFTNPVLIKHRFIAIGHLLRTKTVWLSYILVFVSMTAPFLLIPNISAHLQLNWDYPRARLGLLYFVGGTVSFFTMRAVGRWADKTSATMVGTLSILFYLPVAYFGFIHFPNAIPVVVIFTSFMVAMTSRNIGGQTLFSKIPPPEYRGAYMSLQNALMNMAQGFAAYVASKILIEDHGVLENVPVIGWLSLGFSLLVPPLFFVIEKQVKKSSLEKENAY